MYEVIYMSPGGSKTRQVVTGCNSEAEAINKVLNSVRPGSTLVSCRKL